MPCKSGLDPTAAAAAAAAVVVVNMQMKTRSPKLVRRSTYQRNKAHQRVMMKQDLFSSFDVKSITAVEDEYEQIK